MVLRCFDDAYICDRINVNKLTAISIDEATVVFVGMQVVVKAPQPPVEIIVTVAYTGIAHVNNSIEFPFINDDIRQAVVAVYECCI